MIHCSGVSPNEIGALHVDSQSLLDRSKCIKSELTSLLGPGYVGEEGVDHCGPDVSRMSALFACITWMVGEAWDGRWAVAVCAESHNLGAAAIAAIVGPGASLSVPRS